MFSLDATALIRNGLPRRALVSSERVTKCAPFEKAQVLAKYKFLLAKSPA
jgi:hypothetical protein